MKIGNRKSEIGKAAFVALVALAAAVTLSFTAAQTVRRDLVVDGNGTVVAPSGFWATNAAGITNAIGTNFTPAAHATATNNPHGVTKSQVGLDSVENTALSAWVGSTNLTTTAVGTLGSSATNAASAFVPAILRTAAPDTNSAGTPGALIQSGNHLYLCTGTNIWRRIELLTW